MSMLFRVVKKVIVSLWWAVGVIGFIRDKVEAVKTDNDR